MILWDEGGCWKVIGAWIPQWHHVGQPGTLGLLLFLQSFPKWLKTSFLWHNFCPFLCTDQQCHLLLLSLCASDFNVCFSIFCLLQELSTLRAMPVLPRKNIVGIYFSCCFLFPFIAWKASAINGKLNSQTGNSWKLVPYVLISLSQYNQMPGASCSPSLISWSCCPPAFYHPATWGTALPENWFGKKELFLAGSIPLFDSQHGCINVCAGTIERMQWEWEWAVPDLRRRKPGTGMHHQNSVCALGTLKPDPQLEHLWSPERASI